MYGAIAYILLSLVLAWIARMWPLVVIVALCWGLAVFVIVAIFAVGARRDRWD